MSTIEAAISRRDLLFPFAKKGIKKQSPQTIRKESTNHSQPPDRSKISRRTLVFGGAAGLVITALGLSRPWEQHNRPETLEFLVDQAKKMEDEYKGQDLSAKSTREKYVDLLAGIFAFHNPGYFTRVQLKEAVIFTDNLSQFVQQRIVSSGKTATPTLQQINNERFTTATTDNRRRKIVVNATAEAYQQKNLNQMKNLPVGWNPLKSLRLSILHEFNHLVNENQDPTIFSLIDPQNKIQDKRIEGFRFIGVNQDGSLAAGFNDLHEAMIELQAKDISLTYFGSYFSEFKADVSGEEISILITRLEAVLQAINMPRQELGSLHKKSDLRQFLLILADKAGIKPNASLEERIRLGSIFAGIIERGNQRALQDYVDRVNSIKQK